MSDPQALLASGHRFIASVSGGKDSGAMCLSLKERGIPFEPVFMDTGWEHPSTYDYLRDVLPRHIGPIRWLRSEVVLPPDLEALAVLYETRLGHYSAMVRWALQKAMFPSGKRRWCTSSLKIAPLVAYVNSLDADVVCAVGIRAEESEERAAMPEWEDPPADQMATWTTWRPLLSWDLDDVIEIHKRHGLAPNPLYLQRASRVGCWPCIRAGKDEIRTLADTDPGRVSLIRDLEADVIRLGAERRGTDVQHAWFQARLPTLDAEGVPRWPAWPIDKVVEWSQTSRGGKQVELFTAPPRDAGCMRWGMCDTGSGEKR